MHYFGDRWDSSAGAGGFGLVVVVVAMAVRSEAEGKEKKSEHDQQAHNYAERNGCYTVNAGETMQSRSHFSQA